MIRSSADHSDTSWHRAALSSTSEVSKNQAGEFIVPLLNSGIVEDPIRHDFESAQRGADGIISLRNPGGMVIGLANKHIRSADILLLFSCGSRSAVFPAGLVVRRFKYRAKGSVIATIVGQFIVDADVVTFSQDPWRWREVHHEKDSWVKVKWWAHMSPEDLLVFIAQDMKCGHRVTETRERTVAEPSVWPEESVRRLTTSITCERFSLYVIEEKTDLSGVRTRMRAMMRNAVREMARVTATISGPSRKEARRWLTRIGGRFRDSLKGDCAVVEEEHCVGD